MNGQSRSRCAAFTLTEIMVTVSVIVVIAAIAIPAYRKARATSKIKVAESELAMLAAAVKQLAWDTRRWPGGALRNDPNAPRILNLTTNGTGLMEAHATNFPSNWKGPYISSVPNDPWGHPYFFDPEYLIGGQRLPAVGSYGPNGQGTNDADNLYCTVD